MPKSQTVVVSLRPADAARLRQTAFDVAEEFEDDPTEHRRWQRIVSALDTAMPELGCVSVGGCACACSSN